MIPTILPVICRERVSQHGLHLVLYTKVNALPLRMRVFENEIDHKSFALNPMIEWKHLFLRNSVIKDLHWQVTARI